MNVANFPLIESAACIAALCKGALNSTDEGRMSVRLNGVIFAVYYENKINFIFHWAGGTIFYPAQRVGDDESVIIALASEANTSSTAGGV